MNGYDEQKGYSQICERLGLSVAKCFRTLQNGEAHFLCVFQFRHTMILFIDIKSSTRQIRYSVITREHFQRTISISITISKPIASHKS